MIINQIIHKKVYLSLEIKYKIYFVKDYDY